MAFLVCMLYQFADEALVTVLNLPPRYRNAANGAGRKNDV